MNYGIRQVKVFPPEREKNGVLNFFLADREDRAAVTLGAGPGEIH